MLQQYRQFTIRNGVDNRVIFFGKVEPHNIIKLYKTCHVMVLSSLNEALGNVVLEAMASAMPIITTNTGATELINGNGIVIPKRSSKHIEKALETLIDDRQLLDKMRHKSRNLAENMSWEKTVKEYISVYEEAIEIC